MLHLHFVEICKASLVKVATTKKSFNHTDQVYIQADIKCII